MVDSGRPVRIMVADDEDDLLRICTEVLQSRLEAQHGRVVIHTAGNGREARESLLREKYDLILLDVQMPGVSGLELMHFALEHGNGAQVVMITAYPNYGDAVAAIKEGAFDYVVKPFTAAQLSEVAQRALETAGSVKAERQTGGPVDRSHPLEALLGESAQVREIRSLIERIAPLDENVVFRGETGTGKGLAARVLHECSRRGKRPLVTLDCGSIPRELIESELFGHEKGAFTGAAASRKGLLELAEEGTLFLDEVSEIPIELQTRLLRALQEREFRRVGGTTTRPFKARVVAATNRDLEAAVQEGTFRSDLFYRLHVIPISMPPLREHPEDIRLLATAFLTRFGDRNPDWRINRLSPEALKLLERYHWPGNVRELENVIRRAAAFCADSEIGVDDLPNELSSDETTLPSDGNGFNLARDLWLSQFEERYFRDLLETTRGNVVAAAKNSGVPRATLYRYLQKYELNPADFRVSEVRTGLTDETED
ncbi:MAG: sigma-54-dependent transcriptional regulator [Thermoanaerobaculia bacterium]